MSNISNDPAVLSVANYVSDLIKDGARVGLGSGRASAAFIAKLGERVRGGLKITGVPTSNASEKQARELSIPLVPLTEDLELACERYFRTNDLRMNIVSWATGFRF